MNRLLALGLGYHCLSHVHAQRAGADDEGLPVTVNFIDFDAKGTGVSTPHATRARIDANYRNAHIENNQEEACRNSVCQDTTSASCTNGCFLQGVSNEELSANFGVSQIDGGIQLKYITGSSMGSRVYLSDDDSSNEQYKLFQLKNREFTFDIDVSNLGCSVNGALYFVAMDPWGSGSAGSDYGTGYCDATCRKDVTWLNNQANYDAAIGSCCAELDIWEADVFAKQHNPHPCQSASFTACDGPSGSSPSSDGQCDGDGCEFNQHQLGSPYFHGQDGSVDTRRPFTVVTRFLTTDGTDEAPLSVIQQFYVQDGVRYNNPDATDDQQCVDKANAQQDTFTSLGGLAKMDAAMQNGLTLVFSISDVPDGAERRGSCNATASAFFDAWNFKLGKITSTYWPYTAELFDGHAGLDALWHLPAWQQAVIVGCSLSLMALLIAGMAALGHRRTPEGSRDLLAEEGDNLE